MSDLGWRADGIERARAAGGVELESYRRPGFVAGTGVRIAGGAFAQGFAVDEPWQFDPEPDEDD